MHLYAPNLFTEHSALKNNDENRMFLFIHHTTNILAKLSTWCFEHSGDISYSLLVNPSHTNESWEGRNTCLWIYIYKYIHNSYIHIILNIS